MSTCGDCRHFNDGCLVMDDALCAVKVGPESACPIGKFEALPVSLELEEPKGVIGLREFARLVGVKLGSIQDAIDAGRLTAVIKTRNGRKLIRDEALAEWNAVHDSGEDEEIEDEDVQPGGESSGVEGFLSPDGLTWGKAKTRAEALLAEEKFKKTHLERMELEGKLHRDEDVESVWADIFSRFRAKLLGLPTKAAPIIAASIGIKADDVPKIQAILDSHVREALTELALYDKGKIRQQRKTRTGSDD